MYNNDVVNNFYVDGNNNTIDSDMNTDINNVTNSSYNNQSAMNPISEGVQEKLVHRTFYHDVPHICPVHTRVINHHVYRHFYQPRFTCSEENTITNVQCGQCPGVR